MAEFGLLHLLAKQAKVTSTGSNPVLGVVIKMVTLEEYEKQMAKARREWYKTGIECPKCDGMLRYTDMSVMCSNPPQSQVHCPSCGYKTNITV